VLLERAAHRLITTDDDLLYVALAAGYSSHEAFTRAFARAYDDVLDARIEISVDGIDDEPTLRSLLSRLVEQLAMWDAATHDRSYDFGVERREAVLQMRARLAEAGPAFLMQVRTIVDEGRLDDTFVDTLCDPPETFTYGGMIAHVLTFAAHRRTLVCGALADAGAADLESVIPCVGSRSTPERSRRYADSSCAVRASSSAVAPNRRRKTAAITAVAIATPAAMTAVTCRPWVNASRAASSTAVPSLSGSCSAASSAPPSVSRADAAWSRGTSAGTASAIWPR
jgi:hypothetical protein